MNFFNFLKPPIKEWDLFFHSVLMHKKHRVAAVVGVLTQLMCEHQRDRDSAQLASSRPTLLRSLYTVGLLCRHFNFDSDEFGEKKVCQSQDFVCDMLFVVALCFR